MSDILEFIDSSGPPYWVVYLLSALMAEHYRRLVPGLIQWRPVYLLILFNQIKNLAKNILRHQKKRTNILQKFRRYSLAY